MKNYILCKSAYDIIFLDWIWFGLFTSCSFQNGVDLETDSRDYKVWVKTNMQKYKVQWFSPSLVPNMTSMYHLRNILVKISLVLVTMDINTQGHIPIFRMELINLKKWLLSQRKCPKPKTETDIITKAEKE